MAQNHNRSVAELRRESERTRAELTQTVDALRMKITDTAADIRHKTTPEYIKAEVSDYVATKRRHFLDNLKQQAMDNPMQALAAGTAVAVPAFRIIRSVPLPLLMIGAGLALASPRVRSAVNEKVSDTLEASGAREALNEAAMRAREGWQSARERAESAMEEARSAMTGKAAEARDAATQLGDRASEFGSAARDRLGSAKEALSSGMHTASDTARDTLETTRAKVARTFNATRASAESAVGNHAMLVGGLGLAIGALIAASVPSTRAERTTFGGASDALRRKAGDAASEKFEEAKTAAMSAVDSAADKISEAGLGERMDRTMDDATEKLKTVADDAITTAFEPSQTDHR